MTRPSRYIIFAITAGFVVLTILKSFVLTTQYGGADLRTRVVASRLITTGNSPYFYKWNPDDGERYLDPLDVQARKVNGNVVTPAVLMAMYPLSQLPYPAIHMIWTVLLILAGIGTVYMLCKNMDSNTTVIASSLMLLGLVCSEIWLYNIERGQMYIFYAFLLALMYRLYNSTWKYSAFLSGFIGGLFILFRPFAIVIGIGFLLHGKWKWIWGCLTGFIIGCAIFVLPKPSLWQDYYHAMQEYVQEHFAEGPVQATADELSDKPTTIEGATNLTEYSDFQVARLETAHQYLKKFGIIINDTHALALYAITVLLSGLFFFRLRKKHSTPASLFLFGFLLFILAELFSATDRGAYNVIMWLFPLSIISVQARYNIPVLIIVALGLLLLHHFPFTIRHQSEVAELLFLGLTTGFIFFPVLLKKLQHGFSRT